MIADALYRWLVVSILSISPISELRGAIPVGIGFGLDPLSVIAVSIIFNALVFFPAYFGLTMFHDTILYRSKFIEGQLARIHKKRHLVDKYGYLGLCIFVLIPLPLTGAWTGSILAWLLGMEWKKSFVAIAVGVLGAGIIVSFLTLGAVSLF